MPIIIAIVVLILLLFLALLPSCRKISDLKLLSGLYIAHRGLHKKEDGVPENSLIAFAKAAAEGFAIENDIHITKDNEVVVFHDSTLKRMCGVDGIIEEKTLNELRALRLLDTDERIPTLKECLDTVEGRVPILIEFKCEPKNCKRLCEAANKILFDYKGKYFVQSFYPGVPAWYKRNRKDILRGQLAMKPVKKGILVRLVSNFVLNFWARPDFVAYDQKNSNRLCFKMQKLLGAFPVGWTFRNQEELDKGKTKFKAYIFENFIPKK